MYAIPAETATQGQPFEKENLPGPGKLPFVLSTVRRSFVASPSHPLLPLSADDSAHVGRKDRLVAPLLRVSSGRIASARKTR